MEEFDSPATSLLLVSHVFWSELTIGNQITVQAVSHLEAPLSFLCGEAHLPKLHELLNLQCIQLVALGVLGWERCFGVGWLSCNSGWMSLLSVLFSHSIVESIGKGNKIV